MRPARFARCCCIGVSIAVFTACNVRHSPSITPAHVVIVEQDVRALMQSVARDVTQQGPLAWLKYFESGPSFFMGVNGQMAFQNGAAARDGTQSFARNTQHIELQWGDLRVDPLTYEFAIVAAPWREIRVDLAGHRLEDAGFFIALAEFRDGRWQFRDAHWSSPVPSPEAAGR